MRRLHHVDPHGPPPLVAPQTHLIAEQEQTVHGVAQLRQRQTVYRVVSRSNFVLRSVRNRPLNHVAFMYVGKS